MLEIRSPSVDHRLAIQDLMHRFYWLIDHGRADATADIFTDDARLVFAPGSPKPGTIQGPAIRTSMIERAAMTHVTTRHVISNIILAANSDGSVCARSLLTLFRADDHSRSSTPASVADIEETFVLKPGGWRICERVVTPIFNRP
jgi:hypothetical protein